MIIEIIVLLDDNASNDKFYSNVFDKIDFGNVAVFFLITGIIIVGFIFLQLLPQETKVLRKNQ